MIRRLLSATVLSLLVAAPALAETYKIDSSHSQVRFQYSHLGFSNIVGLLGGIEGELVHDPANPKASAVSVRIPLASVLTGVDKLDAHLKSDDFFDVTRFPIATFTSRSVTPRDGDRLEVTGDLVLHDVSRPVTLDVRLNKIGEHPMAKVPAIGFDASATLRRSEFGIGKYTPAISDEVVIGITIEARAAAPAIAD